VSQKAISWTNIIIILNIIVFLITVATANLFSVTLKLDHVEILYKASPEEVLFGTAQRSSLPDNVYRIPISGLQFYLSQINFFVINFHFYWQLITSMFVHFGIVHLSFNMLALFFFGSAVEYSFGRKRFLIIYFISGLFGNLASLFLLKYLPFTGAADLTPSAGASGAIFGLLGAIAIAGRMSGRLGSAIGYALLILLINSFIPGVNLFAHLFGFLGGILSGYIMIKIALRKRYEAKLLET
jgi:rhomboid protease GluP